MITREDLLTPRTLYGIAGVFVVLGLGVRVAPARVPPAQAAHGLQTAAVPSDPAPTGDERSYAPVAAGNVFSQTRTPPKVRFVPEGRSKPPAVTVRQKPRATGLRLYGITAGTIALIDADPKIRGAELYRVGDRLASGRITRITDSTVVISRPSGTLILRLPSNRRSPR